LTELARSQGKHGPTHDRLMRAYWEEGLDIGDPAVLRTLAAKLGLENADASISGDLYQERIERATAQAHMIGINAIPAFLLDHRLIVLGAQPYEVFEQAFEQLAQAAPPVGK
jgi:predicted DsbA family dithiol-disulfide isomerase